MKVNENLFLLGKKAEDRVTGFTGVVVSISFDLYGCIQALLNPGMKKDKDQELGQQTWFDVGRLKILSEERVMDLPYYLNQQDTTGQKGPADKPFLGKA